MVRPRHHRRIQPHRPPPPPRDPPPTTTLTQEINNMIRYVDNQAASVSQKIVSIITGCLTAINRTAPEHRARLRMAELEAVKTLTKAIENRAEAIEILNSTLKMAKDNEQKTGFSWPEEIVESMLEFFDKLFSASLSLINADVIKERLLNLTRR